jgi:hypothetical protein
MCPILKPVKSSPSDFDGCKVYLVEPTLAFPPRPKRREPQPNPTRRARGQTLLVSRQEEISGGLRENLISLSCSVTWVKIQHIWTYFTIHCKLSRTSEPLPCCHECKASSGPGFLTGDWRIRTETFVHVRKVQAGLPIIGRGGGRLRLWVDTIIPSLVNTAVTPRH